MSENVEKLRKAIREERDNSGSYESEDGLATWLAAADVTDAALAAIEHEIAALQASYDELCVEYGRVMDERDGRPSFEEAAAVIREGYDKWGIVDEDMQADCDFLVEELRALYAEKTAR